MRMKGADRTAAPTVNPTAVPTADPTAAPTVNPTAVPTADPAAASEPKRERRLRVSTLRVLVCALIIGIVGFTFSYSIAWGTRVDLMTKQSSSDVFKSLNLETLDGDSFTSENLKDARITLFNVWGTTCSPCVHELPILEELNQSYDPGEIQVVGMLEDSLDSNGQPVPAHLETAKGYLQKSGATYPTLVLDEQTYAYVKTAIRGTPTTFFVDGEGNIVYVVTGANDLESWKQQTETALSMLDEQQKGTS